MRESNPITQQQQILFGFIEIGEEMVDLNQAFGLVGGDAKLFRVDALARFAHPLAAPAVGGRIQCNAVEQRNRGVRALADGLDETLEGVGDDIVRAFGVNTAGHEEAPETLGLNTIEVIEGGLFMVTTPAANLKEKGVGVDFMMATRGRSPGPADLHRDPRAGQVAV